MKLEDGYAYTLAQNGDTKLHIGHLPYRKSWMLYLQRPGLITTIASLREDSAQQLLSFFHEEAES